MMQKIIKGDNVQIMLGKDRGRSGQVERVLTKKSQAIIAGANTFKRHIKGRQGIEGRIIDITKPINLSNVQLICPNCKKVTRVGFRIDKDIKLRICRKCGKEIGKDK